MDWSYPLTCPRTIGRPSYPWQVFRPEECRPVHYGQFRPDSQAVGVDDRLLQTARPRQRSCSWSTRPFGQGWRWPRRGGGPDVALTTSGRAIRAT